MSKDFVQRRTQELKYGSSPMRVGSPLASSAPDAVFGVDDGPEPYSVSLRLGPAAPMVLTREVAIALALLILRRAVGNATAPPAMRNGMLDMSLLMLRSAGAEVDLGHKEQASKTDE